MNLATFRATSKPVKRAATYRPLTATETAAWLKGANLGTVATAGYLHMCIADADDVPDGLYLIEG